MQVRNNPGKWSRNSANSAGDYAQGASNPRRPWAQSAAAAADNYQAGVTEAMAQNRFEKGVNKAGDAKWQKGIQDKGRARYGQGVAVSEQNYQSGFAPYAATLGSLNLQPRGPKGQNYGRSQQVGEALRNTKTAQ